MSDVLHKPGGKGLLYEALEKIKPVIVIERLGDDVGVFAINTDKGILVAKRSVYGWYVSAHKRAVIAALNCKKPVIVYLGGVKKFYDFDPKEILKDKDTHDNKRGEALMVNWNIKLGNRREV